MASRPVKRAMSERVLAPPTKSRPFAPRVSQGVYEPSPPDSVVEVGRTTPLLVPWSVRDAPFSTTWRTPLSRKPWTKPTTRKATRAIPVP